MKGTQGFTLLETLVALLVLSLIVLGLAQGLRFGLAAWDHQTAAINRDGALDATDRTLRTLIAGILPGSDQRSPAVLGSQATFAFTASMPRQAPTGPVRLADIILHVDRSQRLVVTWSPHLHVRQAAAMPRRDEVLLTGVSHLTLAYFQGSTASRPAGWVDQWHSADPPELVRIHIAFIEQRIDWPDIVVAPMQERDEE